MEQMNIGDILGVHMIMQKELDEAKKKADEIIKARNRACAVIEDAKKRYIKEKTRAKSKKAAEERDGILKSPRFDALYLYERKEDIQEAYGWDAITEAERDRLEALWEERENIKNHVEDGIYRDEVTKALNDAWGYL